VTATLVDLLHLGRPHVIGVYLLDPSEPVIVDCGPSTCVDALAAGLAVQGIALADLRGIVLTHIHPDHAGAAGSLVRRNPRLEIHVSEIGAPHLVDPSRLERSARRLYGDGFDRLFGEIAPVPAENVRVLGASVAGMDVFPTPGHAAHHASFLDAQGACYAGDAVGCLIRPGRFLYPAAPPPEIDLDAWERSLDAILARMPTVLRLPHYGEVVDVADHVGRTRERLREWAGWIGGGMSEADFVAREESRLRREAPDAIRQYRQLPGFDLTYAGIRRYFDKRTAN
jgi:glyoxylase-like metal-dependent hydrolase (beta-lactamase superfamily II)